MFFSFLEHRLKQTTLENTLVSSVVHGQQAFDKGTASKHVTVIVSLRGEMNNFYELFKSRLKEQNF